MGFVADMKATDDLPWFYNLIQDKILDVDTNPFFTFYLNGYGVCVCVCVCVHVCMRVCACACVHVYIHTCVCACAYVCVRVHVRVCVRRVCILTHF